MKVISYLQNSLAGYAVQYLQPLFPIWPDKLGNTFLTIQSGGATDQIFRAVSERILRFEEGTMRAS